MATFELRDGTAYDEDDGGKSLWLCMDTDSMYIFVNTLKHCRDKIKESGDKFDKLCLANLESMIKEMEKWNKYYGSNPRPLKPNSFK